MKLELIERAGGAAGDGALVQDAGADVLATQVEVVLDREGRHQGELLEDGVDAHLPRVVGRGQAKRLTAQLHRPLVRREGAGDDVDERALAGAIFAEEDVHFAGAQVEIDVAQRLHAGKAFANTDEPEKLDGLGSAGSGCTSSAAIRCQLH